MANRDIYARIIDRVEGLNEVLRPYGMKLGLQSLRNQLGQETPLPDQLRTRVQAYAFSRRGHCRPIARDVYLWGMTTLDWSTH